LAASLEVRAPVIYATLLLALTMLPILLLHGLQGSFFAPLAAAFIMATLVSLAVAVLITPPLALIFFGKASLHEEPAYVVRTKEWHDKVLVRACGKPMLAVGGAVVAAVVTVAGLALFNSELLPAFREGHFVLGVAGPPGTSLAVMRKYGEGMSHDLLAIDGIQSVEQQLGRSEGGEDTWGTETTEFHVELRSKLSGKKQDAIQEDIQGVLKSYPGLRTEVLTFLGDRIGESLSGQTAALAVGVYGAGLDTLDKTANAIAAVLGGIDGAADVQVQTPPQTPVVRIDLNFDSLARYGLSAAEVLDAVQAVYQGAVAAQTFADNRALDLVLTTSPELRQDPESVGDLLLRSSAGIAVPLKNVAHVYLTEGRTSIAHEGGRPRQVVTVNPKPADVARVTKDARAQIAAKVKLPSGVYLEYTGSSSARRPSPWRAA
jgi:Cu/Ag efflux pump CusA